MIIFTRFHKSLGSVDLKGPDDWQKSGEQISKMTNLLHAEFFCLILRNLCCGYICEMGVRSAHVKTVQVNFMQDFLFMISA